MMKQVHDPIHQKLHFQYRPHKIVSASNLIPFEHRELTRQTAIEKPRIAKFSKRKWQLHNENLQKDAFLSLKFCEVDLALNKMEIDDLLVTSEGGQSHPHFVAYKLAREQDPTFLNSPQFKRYFLMANDYDTQKTVKSLVRYLKDKLLTCGRGNMNRNFLSPDEVGLVAQPVLSSSRNVRQRTENRAACDGSIMNESLLSLDLFSVPDAESVFEWELCGGRLETAEPEARSVGVISPLNMEIKFVLDKDVRTEDVLLGRGRKHPGNDKFRHLVSVNYDEYEAAIKQEQTKIAKEVVKTIIERGGRFLTKNVTESTWIEIDFLKARLKVAHTFRSVRKQRKRAEAKKAAQQK